MGDAIYLAAQLALGLFVFCTVLGVLVSALWLVCVGIVVAFLEVCKPRPSKEARKRGIV